MSDSLIPFQPAIDEPSNILPSVNMSSSTMPAGTDTCCSLPRVSVKRRSTNFTSASLIIFRTLDAICINLQTLDYVESCCSAEQVRILGSDRLTRAEAIGASSRRNRATANGTRLRIGRHVATNPVHGTDPVTKSAYVEQTINLHLGALSGRSGSAGR